MEKIIMIIDGWDGYPLEGYAFFNGCLCYFERIFSLESDDWSDEYKITLVSEEIVQYAIQDFELFRYWKFEKNQKPNILHGVYYKKARESSTFEQLVTQNQTCTYEELKAMEDNYYNQIRIAKYLKETSSFRALATFKGVYSHDNLYPELFVEWRTL